MPREMFDANVKFISVVPKAANGEPFAILKADDGGLDLSSFENARKAHEDADEFDIIEYDTDYAGEFDNVEKAEKTKPLVRGRAAFWASRAYNTPGDLQDRRLQYELYGEADPAKKRGLRNEVIQLELQGAAKLLNEAQRQNADADGKGGAGKVWVDGHYRKENRSNTWVSGYYRTAPNVRGRGGSVRKEEDDALEEILKAAFPSSDIHELAASGTDIGALIADIVSKADWNSGLKAGTKGKKPDYYIPNRYTEVRSVWAGQEQNWVLSRNSKNVKYIAEAYGHAHHDGSAGGPLASPKEVKRMWKLREKYDKKKALTVAAKQKELGVQDPEWGGSKMITLDESRYPELVKLRAEAMAAEEAAVEPYLNWKDQQNARTDGTPVQGLDAVEADNAATGRAGYKRIWVKGHFRVEDGKRYWVHGYWRAQSLAKKSDEFLGVIEELAGDLDEPFADDDAPAVELTA